MDCTFKYNGLSKLPESIATGDVSPHIKDSPTRIVSEHADTPSTAALETPTSCDETAFNFSFEAAENICNTFCVPQAYSESVIAGVSAADTYLSHEPEHSIMEIFEVAGLFGDSCHWGAVHSDRQSPLHLNLNW